MTENFIIKVRKFDFEKFIYFHGWVYLSPFIFHKEENVLERYLRLYNGKSIRTKIKVGEGEIYTILKISIPDGNNILAKNKEVLKNQIKRIFCFDQEFSDFQEMCKTDSFLDFVQKRNCRGLLRSPTLYEDIIKTVCTTNCDWRNTKKMCTALCNLEDGDFPSPRTILRYDEKTLSKLVPLGYRARTVLEISKLIENRKLVLDEWAKERRYPEIRSILTSVWGIGDYCINHILVLLGDYSFIPIDSEALEYLRKVYFKGKKVSKKEAVEPFEKYNKYKYLAYKYERMARKLNYIDKV